MSTTTKRGAIAAAIEKGLQVFAKGWDGIQANIESSLQRTEAELGIREEVVKLRRQWMELEIEAAKARVEEGRKKSEEMFAQFRAKFGNPKNFQSDHPLARRHPKAS